MAVRFLPVQDGTIDYQEFVAMMRKTQTGGLGRREIMDGMSVTQSELTSESFRGLLNPLP